jgi:Disulphide bond corrector protein DsbC
MLSDVGSKVIRAFGILNTNVPDDHKMMYGMPWPGEYLLAPDGVVRDKLFLRSYEHRPSASQVVLRHFDNSTAHSVEIRAGVISATISLSTDRCFPGQELGLELDMQVEAGWHIYGKPLPANYQSLDLILESPLIGEQSLDLPAPLPLLLPALGETLPVYGGNFKAHGKVGIKWSPPIPAPFLLALAKTIEPGLYTIAGTLRFQACSDEICEPPQAIGFELPLTVEAGIPAAPKKGS